MLNMSLSSFHIHHGGSFVDLIRSSSPCLLRESTQLFVGRRESCHGTVRVHSYRHRELHGGDLEAVSREAE